MSLPSLPAVAQEKGFNLDSLSEAQQEEVLVEAMRRDLPLAIDLLHKKAHEAKNNGGSADWQEDPKSDIGKQLTRIHAGDILRQLASKHFCHDMQLSFFNCCNGTVGRPPKSLLLRQIQSQTGPIAYADC